mgnify:CR=1 FL=1
MVLRARICPDDGTKLVEVERCGVIIDICPTCHGAWFDVSELESITEYAARKLARLKIENCGTALTDITDSDIDRLFGRNFNLPRETPQRFCPCDGAPLELKERHGVIVDWCPICRGIWCDRGELDAIINRTARELAITRCLATIKNGELPLPRDLMGPKPLPIIQHRNLTNYHPRPQHDPQLSPLALQRLLHDQAHPKRRGLGTTVGAIALGMKVIKFAFEIME